MQDWLIHTAQNHHYIIYAITLVLACVEGPILSMIFGVLIKLGYFSFIPVYIILMLGDLIGDTFWYHLGKRWGHPFIKRFGRHFGVTEPRVEKLTKIFHKYTYSILLLSKLTTGFGFAVAVLMTAGIAKIPFLKYITTNLIGQFVWTGMLLAVGYFFSHVYLQVDSVFSKMSIVALFVVVVVIAFGIRNYLKERVNNMKV